MSINPRRQKHFRRRFAVYILLLGILGIFLFFLNIFITSRRPLFISPLGETNIDLVRVEKILKESNIPFSAVTLANDAYLISIKNNGQVELSQNKDIVQQITSLQRILLQLTIEGKSFKSIDFRFIEPIISF